ncbi:MAG: monovalent cation/H+ antiporter complex subunit F [Planctomycetota bacterium]
MELRQTIFLAAVLGIAILTAPYLYRMIAGPTFFDRLLALNGAGTKMAVMLILIGMLYRRPDLFLDLALGLFLLNPVTTLLIARFVREKGGL